MVKIVSLFVVITILTSAVVGGAVYYWQLININNLIDQNQADQDRLNQQIQDLQKQLADIQVNTNINANINTNNQAEINSSDWLSMARNDLGISFKYPKNYYVREITNNVATLEIRSPDYSSELVGQPLKAIIKGHAFFIESYGVSPAGVNLDSMIAGRLQPNQMAVPDQKEIPKEKIGNFEFGLYSVNGYDEALFYNDVNKRGWKVFFESEDPQTSHSMFLEFLKFIDKTTESDATNSKWLTYTNSEYKFSLQYPTGYEFKMTSIATATSPIYVIKNQIEGANMRIEVWDNPKTLSLFDWIKSLPSNPLPPNVPTVINYYMDNHDIDMKPALRFWSGGTSTWDKSGECFQACPRIEIYFVRYDKAFRIISAESMTPEDQVEFEKMIMSLKFL